MVPRPEVRDRRKNSGEVLEYRRVCESTVEDTDPVSEDVGGLDVCVKDGRTTRRGAPVGRSWSWDDTGSGGREGMKRH